MEEGNKTIHYFFADLTNHFNHNLYNKSVCDNYDVEEIIKTHISLPEHINFDSENGSFEAHSYNGPEPIRKLIKSINTFLSKSYLDVQCCSCSHKDKIEKEYIHDTEFINCPNCGKSEFFINIGNQGFQS